MLRSTIGLARRARDYAQLPLSLIAAQHRDRWEGLGSDPGIEWAVKEGLAWLGRAQDASATQDGGVARDYCLSEGWAASYPETTGYIIPTMLAHAGLRSEDLLRRRARRMLDWLVSIQLPGGGFQGGMVNQSPVVPVTFNTGQILIGLAGHRTRMAAGAVIRHRSQIAESKPIRRMSPGDWSRQNDSYLDGGMQMRLFETSDGHSHTSVPMGGSLAVASTIRISR